MGMFNRKEKAPPLDEEAAVGANGVTEKPDRKSFRLCFAHATRLTRFGFVFRDSVRGG